MDHWNEIHTAAHVARLGKVSAAATELGVHRATVIRHIDLLEQEYGEKLFIRGHQGYACTDFGRKLLTAADKATDEFKQLYRLAQSTDLSPNSVITISTPEILTSDISDVLSKFIEKHTSIHIRYISSGKSFKLEYGEADVAFRTGPKPEVLDYVVQHFMEIQIGLFASPKYIERFGELSNPENFHGHQIISNFKAPILKQPFFQWAENNVPASSLRIRVNKYDEAKKLVLRGTGMGFLRRGVTKDHPQLVEMIEPHETWQIDVWRLTHVDMHRTKKIQAFLNVLNDHKELIHKYSKPT